MQINFFMDDRDEADFLAFVSLRERARIIPYAWTEWKIPMTLALAETDSFRWSTWLFDDNGSNPLEATFIPQQGYYVVEEMRSAVVQFSRSARRDFDISEGRLWVSGYRLNQNNEYLSQDPDLKAWYESLAQWIRRRYCKTTSFYWVGPGALECVQRGHRLVTHLGAESALLGLDRIKIKPAASRKASRG